jgi:hypothetical protein
VAPGLPLIYLCLVHGHGCHRGVPISRAGTISNSNGFYECCYSVIGKTTPASGSRVHLQELTQLLILNSRKVLVIHAR